MKVWDVDNGSSVLRLVQCHGRYEITTMAFDGTGKRLITGSRGGDIKVSRKSDWSMEVM